MTSEFTPEQLRDYFLSASGRLMSSAEELNRLDGKLGDGDLGSTAISICRALQEELSEVPGDISGCFSRVASAIARTSGSSFSAVVMTGFVCAARLTKGQAVLKGDELSQLLLQCVEAMSERGGAVRGDKTLLDGLSAIGQTLAKDLEPGVIEGEVLYAVADSLRVFREKPFKIGRARLAPNRGVGSDDPGMVALARMIGVSAPSEAPEPA